MPESHYAALGLDRSASHWDIQNAIDRLVHEADLLAYRDPSASHQLWDRIHQIKEDLLSTPTRREIYDASLAMASVEPTADIEAVAEPLPRPTPRLMAWHPRRRGSPITPFVAGL